MSKSNVGMNAIYNGGLTNGFNVQAGGNKVIKSIDNTAKQIGFFRNVIKPLTVSLGIKSPGVDNLVSKGYGKKKKKRGRGKNKVTNAVLKAMR